MFFKNWILPILIGFIASVILLSILYNNKNATNNTIPKYLTQHFANIGALMQLQNFNNSTNPWQPLVNVCNTNVNTDINTNINTNDTNTNRYGLKITTIDSPVYTGETTNEPIYNYYPKIALHNLD